MGTNWRYFERLVQEYSVVLPWKRVCSIVYRFRGNSKCWLTKIGCMQLSVLYEYDNDDCVCVCAVGSSAHRRELSPAPNFDRSDSVTPTNELADEESLTPRSVSLTQPLTLSSMLSSTLTNRKRHRKTQAKP